MEYFGLQMQCRGKALPFLENRFGIGRPNPNRSIHQLKKSKRILSKQFAQLCLVADLDKSSNIKTASSSYTNPNFGIEAVPSCSSSSHSSISAEKLDEWMRDSVSEIVRNIGEAPFLMYVYSNSRKSSITTTSRLHREKADAESWPRITRRWEEGRTPTPDGIILVGQLNLDHRHHLQREEGDENVGQHPHSTTTALWGIVIQGRGADCPTCYILKTCRVWSSIGFCTHFCLVRATCFGEAADLQLNDSWIL